jgi:NTP pyrophosphatase (non-canonical NTP hydrolase)
MKYEQLISEVENWAKDRGLDKSDSHAQALKIGEELGELFQAFLKEHKADELDAVGDIQVTLIVYCLQRGIDYKKCLADAYSVIENRKGKMIDGTFVKQEDWEEEQ